MSIVVDRRRCTRCAQCQLICPEDAARLNYSSSVDTVQIDPDRCTLCLECVDMCPNEALSEV